MVNKKDLDGVYDFMSKVYQGNWSHRWISTPHMTKSFQKNLKESILAHQLSCIGFWFSLKNICPNLAKLANSEKIYEILWGHDLGEIFIGDISQARQVAGEGVNKHLAEREEIVKMSRRAPKKVSVALLKNFDAFEQRIGEVKDIDVLICKFIDYIQGNHFAIVFGNDFKKNSDLVVKIIERSFINRAKNLLEFLKSHNHKKAYEEVRTITKHHLLNLKRPGVKLNIKKYDYLFDDTLKNALKNRQ